MRAGLLARVSSGAQAGEERMSLPAQVRRDASRLEDGRDLAGIRTQPRPNPCHPGAGAGGVMGPKPLGVTRRDSFVMAAVVPSRVILGRVLSTREWQVVAYLASHAGHFVPARHLAEFLCGKGADPNIGRQNVRRLRCKMGQSFVESDVVLGYRLSKSRAAQVPMVCTRCGSIAIDYSEEWVCYGCTGTRHVDLDVGRAPYVPGTMSGKPWSEEEVEYVLRHADGARGDYEPMSYFDIGAAINRTESAVRGLLSKYGIDKEYVRSAR